MIKKQVFFKHAFKLLLQHPRGKDHFSQSVCGKLLCMYIALILICSRSKWNLHQHFYCPIELHITTDERIIRCNIISSHYYVDHQWKHDTGIYFLNENMTLVFISSMKTWHWYLFHQWKLDTGIYFINENMTLVFISSMKTWHWYLFPQWKHDTGIYFLNENMTLVFIKTWHWHLFP